MNDAVLYTNLRTTLHQFYHWESEFPERVFLKQALGDGWRIWTYREAGIEARKMAKHLQTSGLEPGSHIGIISKNCAHWIMADLAIMIGGYVSVPFYPTLTAKQLKEVIKLGDIKALFAGKLDEWKHKKLGVPNDVLIISFPAYKGNAIIDNGVSWKKIVKQTLPLKGQPHAALDDLWTIIFTSGTTGTPKGVMHTYKNIALFINNQILNDDLQIYKMRNPTFFSFLPLNHIAERVVVEVGTLVIGGSISFAESIDSFAKNLQDTQPTLLFAVPRLWHKFQLAILEKIPQAKLDRLLSIPILSYFIKRKIRKKLGLSKAITVLTGASLTPESMKQWYAKLGIHLREAYGQTENMGGFSLTPFGDSKENTVGKPIGYSECRIDPSNGEVVIKQPWLMTGYYKDPEKSKEVLKNGWLYTGDKGEIDEQGYLKIIGRVKDTFKTAKGEFIVPTKIESYFKKDSYIDQICVCGLGLSHPIGLIVLSDIGKCINRNEMDVHLSELLKKVNSELPGYSLLKILVVVKDQWDISNDLITPTLKMKRENIHNYYLSKLKTWVESNNMVLWEN